MSDLVRHHSPVQGPQGLAWDGSLLWVTSCVTMHLHAIDPRTWSVKEEVVPPDEPVGVTFTGTDFQLVLATSAAQTLEDDHRFVYSFTHSAGFRKRFACPDFSGSMLAYDGGTLFLSQAWDKKLIELNDRGGVVREIRLERRPVGMDIVDGAFYVMTVDDDWGNCLFERMPVDTAGSRMETIRAIPFKARGVAFDGERFWTNDRNDHAIVSFTLP